MTTTTASTTTTTVPTGELPNCSAAVAAPATLFQANHRFVPVSIDGVAGSQEDVPLVTVTGVTQDEPVGTCPDAAGIGTDTVMLRASRKSGGNGRVYHVSFAAKDDAGGLCTGTVSVCVSRNARTACVDDGAVYDSTPMACGLPCADACGLELLIGSVCPNEHVPLPIARAVARAQILLQRAAHDSSDARKGAHIAAAMRAFSQGARAAVRAERKQRISSACATSIQSALADATSALR
jgi:hypothetical protein